tara:strand:+ start:10031 stop:10501 length:471 start_codon:yes stop_codon:yes gene_type:complete
MWPFTDKRHEEFNRKQGEINKTIEDIELKLRQSFCPHDNAKAEKYLALTSVLIVSGAEPREEYEQRWRVKCPDCEKIVREIDEGEFLRANYEQAKKEFNDYSREKRGIPKLATHRLIETGSYYRNDHDLGVMFFHNCEWISSLNTNLDNNKAFVKI